MTVINDLSENMPIAGYAWQWIFPDHQFITGAWNVI